VLLLLLLLLPELTATSRAPQSLLSDICASAAAAAARVDGCLESELEDVLLPHEVAAVAAVGPSGAPSFVLQVGNCGCVFVSPRGVSFTQ
jgi:hypothetical protein